MFRKLRNKIVGINMLTTTIVLFIAFSSIYFAVSNNITRREMPRPDVNMSVIFADGNNRSFSEEIRERIREDREEGLKALLTSLIVTGLCIEFLMLLLSLYLAEQSIKPVRETYESQKQFIANASHEIKTPLAVIQANLEAADIKGNDWIDNAMKKTEELAELNGQLLALARIDANANESKKSEIVLTDFVNDLVAPLKPQIEAKKIKCKINSKTNRSVVLDSAAFRQILNILLDNAIKYCDKNINITVNDHEITVKNDGTTIEKDQLSHLFERFYQVDKTKNGVGLGLAIANEVATKNNWKLIADSDKKSTSFMLKF
jgi:signal transduction histidine kinase